MMIVWASISIATLALFAASMTYVYKIRGKTRYASVDEYLRHAWPIFSPANCFLYLFTQQRGKGPILHTSDFPELTSLQENWQTIRDEAIELRRNHYFESINEPGQPGHYDIGFRTFFKYGWRKYYLTWYGHTHQSALASCPKTVELLRKIPSVKGAMLSTLPPGGKLTRHVDPLACSLRYHLGLATPNSDDCYITVDGNSYSWSDGEAFMFDETYLHSVDNHSDDDRLILMCDIQRPTFFLGGLLNWFLIKFLATTVVPNTEEDKAGIGNKIFAMSVPILSWSKELKKKNRPLYKILKSALNIVLIVILLGILFALVVLSGWVGSFFT